uniref:Gag protein n=1 Tax=Drosophila melanogaster TaxID=7227 RepID=O46114_DROME|nr:Gag protein [Drosophila melanogaster]
MSKKLTQTIKQTTRSVLESHTFPKRVTRSVSKTNTLPVIRESTPLPPLQPINMDSGNASVGNSAPVTPTVSGFSSIATALSATDILAFVKELPTFDGTPGQLDKYITSVEEIIMLIRGTDQTPYGLLTLRAIRNKIVGRADEALNLANTKLIWDDIKSNLLRLYSSKKSEATLLGELQSLPDNLTLGQLFFGLSRIRSQLISITSNSGQSATIIEAKKTLYDEVCLNAFISRIREPLKTVIRLKDPKTIETAYELCQGERARYQNRNPYPPTQNNTERRTNNYNNNNNNNHRDNNNRNNVTRLTPKTTQTITQTPIPNIVNQTTATELVTRLKIIKQIMGYTT